LGKRRGTKRDILTEKTQEPFPEVYMLPNLGAEGTGGQAGEGKLMGQGKERTSLETTACRKDRIGLAVKGGNRRGKPL